jgi:hypothetical protein
MFKEVVLDMFPDIGTLEDGTLEDGTPEDCIQAT